MIKAVFFDIDGTLVSFKTHRMSDGVKAALHALQAKGIKLFVASGRSPLTMDNLDGYPFDGCIAMNGALTILGGEVIDSHPLPLEDSMRFLDLVERLHVPSWVFAGDLAGINFTNAETEEVSRQINFYPERFVDLRQVALEHVVYEYTVYLRKEQEDRFLRPLLQNADFPRWHPYFCDVVSKGLSKSRAASLVLDRLGMTREEAMAFGDGGNDIPMLEYAGTGVAMGNASGEVKAAADHVTLSVDEDGVVEALRHFGLL